MSMRGIRLAVDALKGLEGVSAELDKLAKGDPNSARGQQDQQLHAQVQSAAKALSQQIELQLVPEAGAVKS
jgi:hypothetical protein